MKRLGYKKKPDTRRFCRAYRPRSPIPNDENKIQDRAGPNRNERINSVIQ